MSPALLLVVALAASAPALPAPRSAETVRHILRNEALTQAERPRADWDPGQRDCAGFVRFLFRKALGTNEPLWERHDGTRVSFLEAGELLAYNFEAVSREPDPGQLRTGDLLAFFDPGRPAGDAWHLMLLLEPPGTAPDRVLVVYHNGAAPPDGAVRQVWLADLLEGPAEWRPVSGNPLFLGTFRYRPFTN